MTESLQRKGWGLPLAGAKALEGAGILAFYGISGAPTTAGIAAQAPGLCVVKSSAGDEYDVTYNGENFVLTRRI